MGIARARAGLGEGFERGLRGGEALAQFLGIVVRELVEAEGKAVEEADRLFDRLRRLGEQARHFLSGFEMPLGVGLGQPPRRLQRRFLADAGQHIGERAPLGRVHENVVGRDQRRADMPRQRRALRKRAAHVLAVSQARADPQAAGEGLAKAREKRALPSPLAGEGSGVRGRRRRSRRRLHRDDLQALAMLEQILEVQMALALGRAQIAFGQQPAQPPIGGAISGVGEHVGRAVDEAQPRAGDDAHRAAIGAVLARVNVRAHDAGERVAIGDADPRQTEFGGARDELFRVRSAAKERKIRRRREFGEARGEADHLPSPLAGEGGAPKARRMRGRRASAFFPRASRRDPSPPTPLPQGERGAARSVTL